MAVAYIRARNADPMSSFGDFAAISDIVDEATARVLKREVGYIYTYKYTCNIFMNYLLGENAAGPFGTLTAEK